MGLSAHKSGMKTLDNAPHGGNEFSTVPDMADVRVAHVR